MEPVTIELAEAPLFIVPGKIHLSIEEPGPVEFDPTSLSDQEKQWINNAHRLRKVKVINPNGPSEKKVVQPPSPPPASEQKPIMQQDKDVEIEKVKELLKSPLPALKKSISTSEDLRSLRLLKTVEEKKKKPRKGLIKIIDQRIAYMNDLVAKKIGGQDVGDKLNPIRVAKEDPNIVELLEDEEERQIVIRPARAEDFQNANLEVTD